MDIINDEEKQFLKTLNRGRTLFQKAVVGLQGRNILPGWINFCFAGSCIVSFLIIYCNILGDVAWRLYDTYGFPLDLTQLMAEERGLAVDFEVFEKCRQKAAVSCFFE